MMTSPASSPSSRTSASGSCPSALPTTPSSNPRNSVTSKKPSNKLVKAQSLDSPKRGTGVIHVLTTEGFEEGEDGAVIVLTPMGLSIRGRITEPSLYNVFVPIDTLLEAWVKQVQEIGH